MTSLNRTDLKAKFENGDAPQGSDFSDLIDSFVNLADTSVQTMQGGLGFSGTVSAAAINAGTGKFTGIVSGQTVNFNTVSASSVYAESLVINGVEVEFGASAEVGELYWVATATTTFAGANTWTTAAVVTSSDAAQIVGFSSPENGVLTHLGHPSNYHIRATFTYTVGGNNKRYSFAIMKNATTLTKSTQSRTAATGTDWVGMSCGCITYLTPGDKIRMVIQNNTDTTDLTMKGFIFKALEV